MGERRCGSVLIPTDPHVAVSVLIPQHYSTPQVSLGLAPGRCRPWSPALCWCYGAIRIPSPRRMARPASSFRLCQHSDRRQCFNSLRVSPRNCHPYSDALYVIAIPSRWLTSFNGCALTRPDHPMPFGPHADVGHCPHDDRPERVHQVLLPWIQEVHSGTNSECAEGAIA